MEYILTDQDTVTVTDTVINKDRFAQREMVSYTDTFPEFRIIGTVILSHRLNNLR